MKYRNQFLKYKLHCNQEDGEGGGGGGADGGNGGGENNGDSNLPTHADLWNTDSSNEGGQNGNGSQPAGNQGGQQNGNTNPEEVFNNHVKNINFTDGVDVNSVMTAMQNGDTEAFGTALRQIGENAYRQTMMDSNKILNSRMDKFKSEVNDSVSTATATDKAVSQLNSELPFTKDAAYAPIAQEVFSRYLKQKDMTVEKAIEKTGDYFQSLSGAVGKGTNTPPSQRSGGGFGGMESNTGNADEDGQDWMSFLGSSNGK